MQIFAVLIYVKVQLLLRIKICFLYPFLINLSFKFMNLNSKLKINKNIYYIKPLHDLTLLAS